MDRRAIAQIFVDVVSAGILFGANIGIDYFEPVKRGFWCSDETIRYRRQPETVGDTLLVDISIWAPIVFLAVSEIVYSQVSKRHKLFLTTQEFWYRLITVLAAWTYTFYANALLTSFIKIRVGRLRPVFLDYCNPTVDCSDPINQGQYLTNYTCQVGQSTESFVRMSFPSGHSSESMVSMVFLIVYLWKRYHHDSTRYFVGLVQIFLLIVGLYVAISRIYDNIHHWSDVAAGTALGSAVAVIGTLVPGRLDRLRDNSDEIKIATTSQVLFRSSVH